jgi:hypothetical protein
MPMRFDVKREIKASPAALWQALINPQQLQDGSFGITRIEGEIAPGAKVKVWSEVNPGRAFPLKVTHFQPGVRMVWEGGVPFGLFKGVREFTLTPSPLGTVFQMSETYSGFLSGLITKSIPDLGQSFEKFADGLTAAAEGA